MPIYLYSTGVLENTGKILINGYQVIIKKESFNENENDFSKFSEENIVNLDTEYPGLKVFKWDNKTKNSLLSYSFGLWHPLFMERNNSGYFFISPDTAEEMLKGNSKKICSLYLGVGLPDLLNGMELGPNDQPEPRRNSSFVCFLTKEEQEHIVDVFGSRISASKRKINTDVMESLAGIRNNIPKKFERTLDTITLSPMCKLSCALDVSVKKKDKGKYAYEFWEDHEQDFSGADKAQLEKLKKTTLYKLDCENGNNTEGNYYHNLFSGITTFLRG